MPARIVLQPNGLYARFSTIVDHFTHYAMCRNEAIETSGLEAVQRADDSPSRWDEAIDTIRVIHGENEKVKTIAMIMQQKNCACVFNGLRETC